MGPPDPRDLRISDADRHRVAEHLREAAGEGRLTLEELEERLETTYAARTYADLVPVTLDLPGHTDLTPRSTRGPVGPVPGAPPAPWARSGPPVPWARGGPPVPATWPTSVAVMGDVHRWGPWSPGERHGSLALMGSVVLDLREALLPQELTLTANAVMGSVTVLVDHRTAIDVSGVGVMGSYTEQSPRRRGPTVELDDDSPLVRVRGIALMGSVEVRRKGPRSSGGPVVRRPGR